MTDDIIKLEHVNFWYDRGAPTQTWALREVNLNIKRGEYVAFFGPSGSGKTSLLYLVSGIERSQEGTIAINGRDISSLNQQELAIYRQVGVGMIFQQFNLIPTLNVAANVALPMSFLGINVEKRHAEALKLLKRLNIEDLAERYPYELSGGQQQRVGIARALANNPPIIIADEPLGNLDSENSVLVLEFLKELNEKDKRTVIMVTHEAWSLKDVRRIFYMKDGAIIRTENVSPTTVARSVSQQLFGEIHNELTEPELAAKSLTGLFLRGYSNEELKRFEQLLARRLNRELNAEEFAKWLDLSFAKGGLGLWRQKALKVAAYVEDILAERRKADEVCRELEANPESPLQTEVEKMRSWLLLEYRGRLNFLQTERLNEAIEDRLRQIIDAEMFRKVLTLPKSKFGVGLSMRASSRLSEKLELALAGAPA